MSGDLSTSVATPGMIADDSVVGTKRPCVQSNPEEGMAVSGSNKRQKFEDYSYLDCVYDDDFLIESYEKLTSKEFFLTMIRGRVRVKRLLLFSEETNLSDQLIVRLKGLLESLADLESSKTKLGTTDDPVEMLRLLQLAKQILREWEGIENAIPQPQLDSLSWWCMAPIDYPQAVPSAWLFERRWRDMAYEEIVSLRKKYSCFMDQAYRDSYISSVKSNWFGGLFVLTCKKLLKFMATSRVDIDLMSVEQCYKRVMGIKELCVPKKLSDLVSKCATQNSTDQIPLPNWRDEIYDQIEAFRKMYSLKLDELLRDEVNKMKSSGTPDEASNARRSFLEDSLQFLAMYRDGIALVSEERCRKQLAGIKQFMGQSTPLSPQLGNIIMINWRDLEYEELQVKAHRFLYQLYHEYLINKEAWSKMAACDEDLKSLESQMKRLLKFYKMSRGEMALLFESKEEYYDECWENLKRDLEECIGLVRRLLHKPSWFCDAYKLVPFSSKFSLHLLPKTI